MTFVYFSEGGTKEASITNHLTYMIAKCNLPISFVESDGFRSFMGEVVPLYECPSKSKMTRVIEAQYNESSSKIRSIFSRVDNISLTFDLWTDLFNTRSYFGMTAHFIDEFEFENVDIGVFDMTDPHTSVNINEMLLKLLDDWKITHEKINVIVSDNANNVTKAVTDFFGFSKHVGCIAHLLNLVISNVISKDTTVKSILKKVKSIIAHFKHSYNDSDKLKKVSDLKLIQSCDTRWNSTYYMLVRFIDLIDYINSILLDNVSAPENLNAIEKQTAIEFIKILKPFESATKILSGEKYVSISKVIPVVSSIRHELEHVKPETLIGQDLKSQTVSSFESRFGNILQNTRFVIATLLDPRFKKL